MFSENDPLSVWGEEFLNEVRKKANGSRYPDDWSDQRDAEIEKLRKEAINLRKEAKRKKTHWLLPLLQSLEIGQWRDTEIPAPVRMGKKYVVEQIKLASVNENGIVCKSFAFTPIDNGRNFRIVRLRFNVPLPLMNMRVKDWFVVGGDNASFDYVRGKIRAFAKQHKHLKHWEFKIMQHEGETLVMRIA